MLFLKLVDNSWLVSVVRKLNFWCPWSSESCSVQSCFQSLEQLWTCHYWARLTHKNSVRSFFLSQFLVMCLTWSSQCVENLSFLPVKKLTTFWSSCWSDTSEASCCRDGEISFWHGGTLVMGENTRKLIWDQPVLGNKDKAFASANAAGTSGDHTSFCWNGNLVS